MLEYRKNKNVTGICFEVIEWHEADNHDELLEKYKNNPNIMERGSAPVSGGPIVAYFNREDLCDEYIEFKNNKVNG